MKTVKDSLEGMEIYNQLTEGEKFLAEYAVGKFEAVKIEGGAIFENACGKYIVAKAYKNCLSIGSGYILEFETLEEAKENAAQELRNL